MNDMPARRRLVATGTICLAVLATLGGSTPAGAQEGDPGGLQASAGLPDAEPADVRGSVEEAATVVSAILAGEDDEARWNALGQALGIEDVDSDPLAALRMNALRAERRLEGGAVAQQSGGLLVGAVADRFEALTGWRPATREEAATAMIVLFAFLAVTTGIVVFSVRLLRWNAGRMLTRARARGGPRRAGRSRGRAPVVARDAARLEARLRARKVA